MVFGSVLGPSSQRANECRIAMFLAGFPSSVPVHTVNRWAGLGGRVGGRVRACMPPGWWAAAALASQSSSAALPTAAGPPPPPRRQCSSGLQAIAEVAAAIKAGYYTIGIAGGVESMTINPMAWEGGINPKVEGNQQAQDCLLPMGEPH